MEPGTQLWDACILSAVSSDVPNTCPLGSSQWHHHHGSPQLPSSGKTAPLPMQRWLFLLPCPCPTPLHPAPALPVPVSVFVLCSLGHPLCRLCLNPRPADGVVYISVHLPADTRSASPSPSPLLDGVSLVPWEMLPEYSHVHTRVFSGVVPVLQWERSVVLVFRQ